MSNKLMRLLAIIFALSLLASACGSDDADDGDTAAAADDDAAADDTAADDDADDMAADDDAADDDAADDGAAPASSIEELEAQWAEARAAVIARIEAEGWGVEGDILTGPGGWTVDLSNCPANWSDTAGVADGVVTIGHTTAQSGPLAAYGNIANGMAAYIDYVNENGGIGPDGLQINLIVKDDAYVATQTQEQVAELLQTEDPFYIQTLGSPNTFAVQGTMNDSCVPQPLSMTGHQAWGDPENYPWTTGFQMAYSTEALLWGEWIELNYDEPVTVGALVMDNDFGLAYEQALHEFAEESDIVDVSFVRHDPAAATLTNEMTTLAAANPDVVIVMTAGNPCVLAIQEAERAGLTESASALFMPSVCKAVSDFMLPAGEGSDGWLIFGGGIKDNSDPQWADDPYVSWMNEQMASAGLDGNSSHANGFGSFGWPAVEVLRIAAELEGGLTRTNYMLALRAFRSNHPLLLEGINFGMNGLEDAYLIEGSELARFDFATEQWNVEGDVIDLDGQSPNCAWIAGEGC